MTTFAPIFAPAALRAAVDDRAWIGAMLEAERALAAAESRAGLVSAGAAAAIAEACRVELYDVGEIVEQARLSGTPATPLVRALRDRVGPDGADSVHRGATSQDILDTAAMLVCRSALDLIVADLAAVAAACARLAEEHRDTPMAARTLLQQAVPTTFGLKAAGWLVALLDARARLVSIRRDGLAAQLGGAAGTLGALGAAGPEVARLFARELDLAEPTLPWHTNRVRIAELGAALASVAGVAGKIGLDVALLMQIEVGEVAEPSMPGRGGSSAMPHKRNPVGSALAVAGARSAAAAAGLLTESLLQEHERAAGAWHAEWAALSSALVSAGGAVASIREVTEGLQVSSERMRRNLELGGGLLMAEQVALRLTEAMGAAGAHQIVRELSLRAAGEGGSLRDELIADGRVREHLSEAEIDAALDPAAALEAAGPLVDRALDHYRKETGR